ncbi:MAG: hypothetical protein ABJM36_13295 [Algibacter sp.]|uniref:hypothetical protein n=1 Tax=Algibacter sp. TaxID=1872428 RepID=UPI0032975005
MDLHLKNKVIIINRCNKNLEKFEEAISDKIIEKGGLLHFIEFENHEYSIIKNSKTTLVKTSSIKDCIDAIFNIYGRIDIVISKTNSINTNLNSPIDNDISTINLKQNYHNQFVMHSDAYLKSSNGNLLVINSNEDLLNKINVLDDYTISNNQNFRNFDKTTTQKLDNTLKTNYIYFSKKNTNNHDYLVSQCLFLISKHSILNKNIIYKENRMFYSN